MTNKKAPWLAGRERNKKSEGMVVNPCRYRISENLPEINPPYKKEY